MGSGLYLAYFSRIFFNGSYRRVMRRRDSAWSCWRSCRWVSQVVRSRVSTHMTVGNYPYAGRGARPTFTRRRRRGRHWAGEIKDVTEKGTRAASASSISSVCRIYGKANEIKETKTFCSKAGSNYAGLVNRDSDRHSACRTR